MPTRFVDALDNSEIRCRTSLLLPTIVLVLVLDFFWRRFARVGPINRRCSGAQDLSAREGAKIEDEDELEDDYD
jgi:hypothetical protein